ncbi:unnamed protein product, partial [Closterium sp. NIES-54]
LRAATCRPLAAPCCCLPCSLRCPTPVRPVCCAAMASLCVLTFDHEGRLIQFVTWLDELQQYLLSDSRERVSLFDHTSGASLAPPATADSATRSQWLTHDAAARLAIRNHLPLAECTHIGKHRTAQALYDVVVARYSSPTTAALGRLLLPYLFPEMSAFATLEDLITHLHTSDDHYRAALPAEDHFLALDPTALTVDLLEQPLLVAETSIVAVGATRGTPRTPFFEGCSPSPLAPSYASAGAVDVLGAEDVGAASASGKRRSSKGKGGRGGGGGSGGGGGGSSGGGGGGGGSGGGGGGFGGSGGGNGGGGGSGGNGSGGSRAGAVPRGGSREFGDEAERPRWTELLRSGVAIFDLDYDAILAAMYALSVSGEGVCYLYLPPDPCIEAAALGASESTLPGTAPAEALHTFTLDSGASRCFFRDSTTLIPLSAPVPVRLADSSGGPVLARSSTVLPCPAVPSGSLSGLYLPSFSTNLVSIAALQDAMVTTTTPGGHRVSICTCTRTGRHLAMFTRRPGSSLYTLATEPPLVAAPAQVYGPVAPPSSIASCRTRLSCGTTTLVIPPCHAFVVCTPTSLSLVFPVRLQLYERFRQDLPVLRLHSNRGGEFSSDLLRDFCRGEGILQSFTLPASPQQNGIAERRIGLVMELNLWPRFSLLETSPTLRWKGEVGNASVFRFYHPTSRRVFPSHDVTFDESVPLYRLFPYRSAPPPPPPLFLAPGPPPVLLEVLRLGVLSLGVESPGSEGDESEGAGAGGAELGGAEPGGAEPTGEKPGGAESEGVEGGGAEPRGIASSGGSAGALPRLSPRPEPLSLQQLREWFAQCTRLRSGAAGAGASATGDTGAGGVGATRLGGAGVTAGAGGTGGAAVAGRGGAHTRGTRDARARGAGAGDPAELGGAGARGAGAGGAGAGDTGAVRAGAGGTGAGGAGVDDTGAVDPGAGGAGAWGAVSGGTGAGGIVRLRPFFVPLLRQVLSLPSSTGFPPSLLCPLLDQPQPPLQPASPHPAPSPYSEQT